MRGSFRILLLAAACLFAYLLLWPSHIAPLSLAPPPDPGLTGAYASNHRLRTATQLARLGDGPEDVARGPDGRYYTGLQDGRIVRFREQDGRPETFANTGGRPLGIEFDRGGNLIVADAFRGLLSIDAGGGITVLTDKADGERLLFSNDLDIAADGAIWFTNASQRHDQHHWVLDFLETRASGGLLKFDPRTGHTTLVLKDLMFANGVALGPGDEYVLVNETIAARITRLWISGSRAGQRETFLNLPAYPDNLSSNGKGLFWVALAAPRNALIEHTWTKPFLRGVLGRLPYPLLAASAGRPYSWFIGVDSDGRVVHNLQDPRGGCGRVSSVNEFDGKLYLGSISTSFVSTVPAP